MTQIHKSIRMEPELVSEINDIAKSIKRSFSYVVNRMLEEQIKFIVPVVEYRDIISVAPECDAILRHKER